MTGDKEIKGYTKEMIREILGSSWPQPSGESGNQTRRRIGQERRDGKRPKVHYPTAEDRAKLPNFDENGKYIYPPGSGFSYSQYLKDNPDSTEAGTYGSKVS